MVIIKEGQKWRRFEDIIPDNDRFFEGEKNFVRVKEVIQHDGYEYIFYHSLWKPIGQTGFVSCCIRRDIFERTYFLPGNNV